MKKVEGKTFLVTGGASGLGEATVVMLVSKGANVTILDRDEELGQKLANSLPSKQTLFLKTDVCNEDSVKNSIKETISKFGSLNGAINCAGVGSANKIASKAAPHSLELFQKVIEINLTGTFNVCRLVSHQLIQQKPDSDGERGILINVASIAAFDGQNGQVAYSASKGGIVSMTLVMARDLGRYGIRAMTIAPGLFETPMTRMIPDDSKKQLAKDVQFPQRMGQPIDFAQLVLSIIQNPYLNGETIRLDGGLRMPAL